MDERIVISMGNGRLHAVELSKALLNNGVKPTVIGGWVPRNMPRILVNMLGLFVSRDNLYDRLMSRAKIHDCGGKYVGLFWPEALTQIGMILSRMGLLDQSKVAALGWQFFGKCSQSYLQGEIFHVRSGAGQGGAIKLAKSRGLLVVADHSIAHPCAMQANLEALYQECNMKFNLGPDNTFWKVVMQDCKDADIVVVNSDYVKDTFVANGFEEDKVVVNYWGVRDDFVALKDDHQLSSDGVMRLLFTGQFGLRKGAMDIIESARILHRQGIDCKFIVAGRANDGIKLLEEHAPELQSMFEFCGFIPQDSLKELFKSSDAFVFPSYSEGCARSAMEALAAGLPVICTRETGLPDTDQKMYYEVKKGDPVMLSNAILELYSNEMLRREIGLAGTEYIRQYGSWNNYGGRLLQMYREHR